MVDGGGGGGGGGDMPAHRAFASSAAGIGGVGACIMMRKWTTPFPFLSLVTRKDGVKMAGAGGGESFFVRASSNGYGVFVFLSSPLSNKVQS